MSHFKIDQPVTFALVGCGAIAPTQAKALAALRGEARLTHCCDLDGARAVELAEKFQLKAVTFEEILADPGVEAVTLCTPSGAHGELAARALRAGKHVVVEKPLEVSVAACEALCAVAAEVDRRFAVISQHRFDPASQVVKEAVEAGRLGRMILVDARIPWYRTQEYYDSGEWRGTWAMDGGGCLMNQGVHTVDLMLWLAGPVKTVYAQVRTAAHERIEVEDVVSATLTFESGAVGTLMASTACYPGFLVRLGLHGTEGSAIIEGDELHTLAIKGGDTVHGGAGNAHALQVATGGTRSATANAGCMAEATEVAGAWAWGDAHRAQFADFARAVRAGGRPLVGVEDGRAAVALIHAVYESSRRNAVVTL